MTRSIECRTLVAVVLASMALGAWCAPPPVCPSAGDDDPRASRFCQALNTFLELYAEAAGEQVPEYEGHYQGAGAYSSIECRTLVAIMCAWCAPPPVCPSAGDDDPRASRFCQALNTFLELYAEAAGEQVPEYEGHYQALNRDYPQLLDNGMKRQDVVHSFLRFGRRR